MILLMVIVNYGININSYSIVYHTLELPLD